MAHLGEQAITGERQHDHAERLADGVEAVKMMSDEQLADALEDLADRIFVRGHRNARVVREAADRLGAFR